MTDIRPPSEHGPLTIVATAIHAGHELRPALARCTGLDEATRLREEDPFTNVLAQVDVTSVAVDRSRFEVDLNRPRDGAIYRRPEDAWGLEVWREQPPDQEFERSLEAYDAFYDGVAQWLDGVAGHGPFVLLDIHSYNHRRDGADAPAAPEIENPEINVGTGTLDRDRWGSLADAFVQALAAQRVRGHHLDVRENVRFQGGNLSRWVNERYGGRGCALALEFKKTFMDEWSGALDREHLEELRRALASVVPVLERGGVRRSEVSS